MSKSPVSSFAFLLIVFLFFPASCFTAQPAVQESLEESVSRPLEDVSLWRTAMLFSREVEPGIEQEEARAMVLALADDIRPFIQPGDSPKKILRTLKKFIYQRWGFHVPPAESADPGTGYYDTLIRFSQESPEEIYRNSFLLPVIRSKQGNCVGLTSVYLALAQELNLPIYPVMAPYHIFPRYDDGKVRINIEATAGGRSFPDSFYVNVCHLSNSVLEQKIYLSTLTVKDLFSSYYLALGSYHAARGLPDLAEKSYAKALELSPHLTLAYSNLAFVYSYYGMKNEWTDPAEAALSFDPDFPGTFLTLAGGFVREGNYKSAIQVAKELTVKYPDFAYAHAFLGELLNAEGLLAEAVESLGRSVRLEPWNRDFYASLGKVYYYKKDYPRAWKYANRAKELGFSKPNLFNLLKRASSDPGKYPEDEF